MKPLILSLALCLSAIAQAQVALPPPPYPPSGGGYYPPNQPVFNFYDELVQESGQLERMIHSVYQIPLHVKSRASELARSSERLRDCVRNGYTGYGRDCSWDFRQVQSSLEALRYELGPAAHQIPQIQFHLRRVEEIVRRLGQAPGPVPGPGPQPGPGPAPGPGPGPGPGFRVHGRIQGYPFHFRAPLRRGIHRECMFLAQRLGLYQVYSLEIFGRFHPIQGAPPEYACRIVAQNAMGSGPWGR